MIAPAVLQRCAVVIAAATTAKTLLSCDCNPSIYLSDRWFHFLERNNWFKTNVQQKHPFDNKSIWIIGASTGIGEELAYQLASSTRISKSNGKPQQQQNSNHAIHLILSSRSIDKLEEVATTCRLSNPNCSVRVLGLDVTNDDELIAAVNYLTNDKSLTNDAGIDCVVCNAGCGHLSPAAETSIDTIDTIWKQTARWPMVLIPLLFQNNLFRDSNNPHIVVTSSIGALVPVPLSAVYASAKSALTGYFRSLHSEQPNILLHTIMPGPIDTNFHKGSPSRPITASFIANNTSHFQSIKKNDETQGMKSKPMKMSVQRCVEIMITTMRLSYSTETWIARAPILYGLYLQKLLPTSVMQSTFYGWIGPKRVDMWRNGLDLYDPSSWRK